jgi:4-oxalocrotonate tautomerase
MPHVVVKLLSGRSEIEKQGLADELSRAVTKTALCGEEAVSVAIEDVEPGDWDEKVFRQEIAGKADTLYKKPGYKAV